MNPARTYSLGIALVLTCMVWQPRLLLAKDDTAEWGKIGPARGGFQVVPAVANPRAQVASQRGEWPTLVYMNRFGGVYSYGSDSSSDNISRLVQGVASIPAADINDDEWQAIMHCVQLQFAAFNLNVVDVDPGAAPHIESVVGGHPSMLSPSLSGVAGLAPFSPSCSEIPNAVVFTFTEVLPRDSQKICEIATQEIAHSFGLDHEYLCSDPMSYLADCGAKAFQNLSVPCGEYSPRACADPEIGYDCNSEEQNSVQLLREKLGLRSAAFASLRFPKNGAQVDPGFSLQLEMYAADSATIRIDGEIAGTIERHPYYFITPKGLSDGSHIIEVLSQFGGVETSHSIFVTVGDASPGDSISGGCSFTPGKNSRRDGIGTGIALVLLGCVSQRKRRRREAIG